MIVEVPDLSVDGWPTEQITAGEQPPLAGDQLVLAVRGPNEDWIEEAAGGDISGEVFEGGVLTAGA